MTRRTKKRIPDPIAARLTTCRERMAKAKLSAFLITHPVDQIYLTGFTGDDGAAVIAADKVYLITDGRFDEQADREAGWAKKIVRSKAVSDELTKLRKRLRWKRVGFQADRLTVAQSLAYRKAIKPARLVRVKPIAGDMRLTKDAGELRETMRAINVAQDAFRAACKAIRIGMTEHEIAARLDYEMQRRGATGPAFQTIVAEGPNAALPHYRPGNRRIRAGSAILIDWGAVVGHYRSDLTRVVFVRRIPPRFRRMYAAVLEAQRRAIAAVRPGVSTQAVDRVARSYLKSVGYGKAFTHGTGHGLGLDIHEAPSLSRRNPVPLKPGMIVTIEPGVYIRGVGGVRIEDDVQVTQDGVKVLTSLTTNLNDMVIRG